MNTNYDWIQVRAIKSNNNQGQLWRFLRKLPSDSDSGGNGLNPDGTAVAGPSGSQQPSGQTGPIDPGVLQLLKGINDVQKTQAEAMKIAEARRLQDSITLSNAVNGVSGMLRPLGLDGSRP